MTPEDRLKEHFWTMLVALCQAEANLANAQGQSLLPAAPPLPAIPTPPESGHQG